MKPVLVGAVLLLSIVPATGAQPAATVQRYDIDPAHTHIGFGARHLMVTTVRGKFNTFRGYIELDTVDVRRSRVNIEIDVASIDTDNQRRDDHLRSDDFFDVQRFPTITFTGDHVEPNRDGFLLHGTLGIRDVTKPVVIPFELNGPVQTGGRTRIGAEGALRINRFDYGVQWSNTMETGGLVVAPEIRIELHVQAITPRP
jgi:polyisoprenoid-binding protein YceI